MNINEFVTDGKSYIKKSVIIAIYDHGHEKCSIHITGDHPGCFILEIPVEEATRQVFGFDEVTL